VCARLVRVRVRARARARARARVRVRVRVRVRERVRVRVRVSMPRRSREGVRAPLREPAIGRLRVRWLRLSQAARTSSRTGALSNVLHVCRNAWQPLPKVSRHQRVWLTITSILGDRLVNQARLFALHTRCEVQVPFKWPVKSRTARGARRRSGGQLRSSIVDRPAAAAVTKDSPTSTGSLVLPPLRPTAIGSLPPSTWPVLTMGRLFSTVGRGDGAGATIPMARPAPKESRQTFKEG
jgi:hypothetical protein